MEKPPGYVQDNSSLVCLLNKSLYGLKQAPRAWYAKWIAFSLTLVFLDAIRTPMSIARKYETISSYLLNFMLMILSLMVGTLAF